MTWEPGNTGTPAILNIWEPGNTGTVSPYTSGRKSIYIYIWTVRPYISGRQSIYGPHGPYLKAPCCLGRLGEKSILGTFPWKNECGILGNNVKTNNFLKMAPQAKPLCSRDLCRNSV